MKNLNSDFSGSDSGFSDWILLKVYITKKYFRKYTYQKKSKKNLPKVPAEKSSEKNK